MKIKMNLVLISTVIIILILIGAYYLMTQKSIDNNVKYTLTLISNPEDKVDIYEYVDWNDAHQGKEIYYLQNVNSEGRLKLTLPYGRYSIFARCINMCNRAFNGPKVINLNENQTVQLDWKPAI